MTKTKNQPQKEILNSLQKKNVVADQLQLSIDNFNSKDLCWYALFSVALQGVEVKPLMHLIKCLKNKWGNALFEFPIIDAKELLKEIDSAGLRGWALRSYFYGIVVSIAEAQARGVLLKAHQCVDPVESGQLLRKHLFYIGKQNPNSSKVRLLLHFLHAKSNLGANGSCDFLFMPPYLYWGHPAGLGKWVSEKQIKPWSNKDPKQRIIDLKRIASYLCEENPQALVHWHLWQLLEN